MVHDKFYVGAAAAEGAGQNTRKNARDNRLFKFLGKDHAGATHPMRRFRGCNTLLEMVRG